MFSHLSDFKYSRTRKEALGFYFAYLLLLVVVGGILAVVLVPSDVTTEAEAFEAGAKIGTRFAPIAVLSLGILLLHAKKTLFKFKNMLLLALAGLLAIIGGGLLGLIPVAYLSTTQALEGSTQTTQSSKKKSRKTKK